MILSPHFQDASMKTGIVEKMYSTADQSKLMCSVCEFQWHLVLSKEQEVGSI